jgi:hypothetical protein
MAKAFRCVKLCRADFFIKLDFLIGSAIFANEFKGLGVIRFTPMIFDVR